MREVVYFIASLAGAAILTALAVLVQNLPVWQWVLWGGISAFSACAIVLLVDLIKPGGPVFLLIGMGVGIALFIVCAIPFCFQQRVKDEAGLPDIVLLSPVYDFRLAWRAPTNNEVIMLPERGADKTPLRTGVPIFRIKNIGNNVARRIRIEWNIDPTLLKKTVERSPRLQKYVVRITDHNFGIFEGALDEDFIENSMNMIGIRGKFNRLGVSSGYVANYAAHASTEIPYLAPEINNEKYQEAEMPFEIEQLLQLLFIASLPSDFTPTRTAISVFVSIHWTNGDTERRANYRIDAKALNISDTAPAGTAMPPTPEVLAIVKFEVAPIDEGPIFISK